MKRLESTHSVTIKIREGKCYIVGADAGVQAAKAEVEAVVEKQKKFEEKDAARGAEQVGRLLPLRRIVSTHSLFKLGCCRCLGGQRHYC